MRSSQLFSHAWFGWVDHGKRRYVALALLAGSLSAEAEQSRDLFHGVWSNSRCESEGGERCGGLSLYLVQRGNDLCGSYFYSSMGAGQLDEGDATSVRGTVHGKRAEIKLTGARDGADFRFKLTLRANGVEWRNSDEGELKPSLLPSVAHLSIERSRARSAFLAEEIRACAAAIRDGEIVSWRDDYVEPSLPASCDDNALTMAECARGREVHSRRHLDSLIARVVKLVKAAQADALQRAQVRWISFRDASCEFDAKAADGNSAAYEYALCQHTYNTVRIETFSKYAYCRSSTSCSDDVAIFRQMNATHNGTHGITRCHKGWK